MKNLTRRVLKDHKIFQEPGDVSALRAIFEECLDEFIAGNYPDGFNKGSLMCSIHNEFQEGHNCVGCNLNAQNQLIEHFLAGYSKFANIHLVMVNFIHLLYLMVERYNEYFKISEVPDSYRQRHFQIFKRVISWANFIKHPKSFVLSHHAGYFIDSPIMPNPVNLVDKSITVIDDNFVKTYYSGAENNGKLYRQLQKNDRVHVIFPDPIDMVKKFTTAQQKFVAMIRENEMIRVRLDDEATVREYFESSQESEQTV